ncbi:hypothetical protein HDU96_002219 [Phlyctochytrium bullatum]|nr:hypothetical protein HDU96_002219 [Phlyctochytrium bullatum]
MLKRFGPEKLQDQKKREEELKKRRVISIDLERKRVVAVNPEFADPIPAAADVASAKAIDEIPLEEGASGLYRNLFLDYAPKYVPIDLEKLKAEEESKKRLTIAVRKAAARAAQAQVCEGGKEGEASEAGTQESQKVKDGLTSKQRRAAKRETQGKNRVQVKVERLQDHYLSVSAERSEEADDVLGEEEE